jgi:hypothetical protein
VNLNQHEARLAEDALRVHARALQNEAKSRNLAGERGRAQRWLFRDQAAELLALADRLEADAAAEVQWQRYRDGMRKMKVDSDGT